MKISQRNAVAMVCWKDKIFNNWKSTFALLGKNKKILDVES